MLLFAPADFVGSNDCVAGFAGAAVVVRVGRHDCARQAECVGLVVAATACAAPVVFGFPAGGVVVQGGVDLPSSDALLPAFAAELAYPFDVAERSAAVVPVAAV